MSTKSSVRITKTPDVLSDAVARRLIEAGGDCIAALDRDGDITSISAESVKALRLPASPLGACFSTLWSIDGTCARVALHSAERNGTYRFESLCQPGVDGRPSRWWCVVIAATDLGFVLLGQDVTSTVEAANRRMITDTAASDDTNQEHWRLALEAGHMAAWSRDLNSNLLYRSHETNIHVFKGNVIDTDAILSTLHAEDRPRLQEFLDGKFGKELVSVAYRFNHPTRGELWAEASGRMVEREGSPSRMMGVTSDITKRKMDELKLEYASTHDILTGLQNRTTLQGAFQTAIRVAKRARRQFALFLLDLDNFKDVNDTLGHDAGDAVLRAAAKRIACIVPSDGYVARLGGDEFAILVPLRSECDAADVADLILMELAKPFRHAHRTLDMKASIGIAIFPDHGAGKTELMKNADLALYAAKDNGRARAALFCQDMRSALEDRLSLAARLREALAAHQVVPFYQPKVDLSSGKVVGLEALARWIDPVHGVRTPGEFMSAFDDQELAMAIDETMLRNVVRDTADWMKAGLEFGRVSINLSNFAFRSPRLVEWILEVLAAAGVPASCFEIEVTETVFLNEWHGLVAQHLSDFRAAGIKVSLDDFGTGHASLTHLKSFTIDEIKIDRSFVRNLTVGTPDAAIVTTLVTLGRQLGLSIIAEGVETLAEADMLRHLGCRSGQGFLFAKAMAASRIPWLVLQRFETGKSARAKRQKAVRAA